MGGAPCNCAKVALEYSAVYLGYRVDCIRLIDDAIAGSSSNKIPATDEDTVSILAKAHAAATAEKQAAIAEQQAAIRAEQAALAAAAKAEKEATKAAKAAEAEAAKAAKEAAKLLAKARAKEEADEAARQAKVEKEAAERQAKVEKEAADLSAKEMEQARALAKAHAKEAERQAKAEKEEQKRLAKEAKEAEQARSTEEKRVQKEAALAETLARKAAADQARAEAERAKEEADAIAARERQEREERAAAERSLAKAQARVAEMEARAQKEEQKRLAKEAKEAEQALSAEEKRQQKEAEKEARKAAEAMAARERQEQLERAAAELAAAGPMSTSAQGKEKEHVASPRPTTSSAAAISQQRLERANNRFGSRFGSFGNLVGGASSSADKGGTEDEGAPRVVQTDYAKAYKKIGKAAGASDSAAKALKVEAADGDDGDNEAAPYVPPEVDTALSKPLSKWRGGGGGGVVDAELVSTPSFYADCLALSSDGDTLAGIGGDGDGKTVSLYSVRSKSLLHTLRGHTDLVCSVAVRSDGGLIASGARDKTIRLWSPSGGECTATLQGCQDMICGLAFHPTSERRDWLLSGEKNGKVRLWSVDTEQLVCTYEEHNKSVWSVAMGAKRGVSASHDTKAKVWALPDLLTDVTSAAKSRATLTHPTWVFSVSVADVGGAVGELAATGCGDRLVRLWALSTGSFECLRTYSHGSGMPAHPVLSVRLLGGLLVSGGRDGTLRLWSLERDIADPCLATLTHGEDVHGLVISRSHGFVASCGGSGKRLAVWQAS